MEKAARQNSFGEQVMLLTYQRDAWNITQLHVTIVSLAV